MPVDVDGEARVLAAFRRTAAEMPWYRALLAEAAVHASEIVDLASFVARVPVLTRSNTFDRFAIDQLAATTDIPELAGVLTSSGHGGRFAFGLVTRDEARLEPVFIDHALDAAFGVRSRRTLVLNCLPMGVVFRSAATTVATTSVREDMALGLLTTFGSQFEQVVIVADPLFLKRLLDFAETRGYDWRSVRTRLVLGEEMFGEHFRTYAATALGLDVDGRDDGSIISSFGVGELGLHLAYETGATIGLRRAAWRDAAAADGLLGAGTGAASLPALLAFNPERTFVEVVDPDSTGYGQLALSTLDPGAAIPLLRYVTGDHARLLDRDAVGAASRIHGNNSASELPPRLIALRGRVGDRLPNGSDVGLYKDALYADPAAALELSGAFRITVAGNALTWHVQRGPWRAPDRVPDGELAARLLQQLPRAIRPSSVLVWRYEQFPFGMNLDYQRKFAYH